MSDDFAPAEPIEEATEEEIKETEPAFEPF